MINFKMNMPFYLMAFYGSIMIVVVLLLRALLKNRLPKFVFPALWTVILLRLLIPFSVSSPLSMEVPVFPIFSANAFVEQESLATAATALTEDKPAAAGTASEQSEDAFAQIPPADALVIGAASNVFYESPAAEQSAVTEDAAVFFNFHHKSPYGLILSLYFAGLAITAAVLICQRLRYMARLKNSLLIEHNETVNTLLREMNMGHILVFTNDEIASPLVCGLIAPKIYLPTGMNFDNAELLRHILCHETMHIRRGDNRLKIVMLAALCVHWFNPLVWLMSKYFASDIETACDEAVLRHCPEEEAKKGYASSLLAMAVSGSRQTLLYSAFSKTEVERRIRNVLRYRKAPGLLIVLSVCLVLCGSVVFATGGQAPYNSYLTNFLGSAYCRFGVRVNVTRDVLLGSDSHRRAERIVFDVMREDQTDDPDILNDLIRQALSKEFHVEPGAFAPSFSLLLDDEERYAEYAKWDLLRMDPKEDSMNMTYRGETIRCFSDEMSGRYQTQETGSVDVTVIRDRLGYITGITVFHEGDIEYDRRTDEMRQYYW